MGKGALKFGGKSGYLPRPRPIFKKPIFPTKNFKELQKTQKDVGYVDGVQHPKGTTREQKFEKFVPLAKRLEMTAALPKTQYTAEQFAQLPIEQQIKLNNSEMRRSYLRESYLKEATRLELEKAEQESEAELDKIRQAENLKTHEESEAFKLTIPSVEQYLLGPIMRQRTPEEKLLLKQKREANKKNQELKLKTKQAISLLELYNDASSFIINEEQLNEAIYEAFDKPNDTLKNMNSDNFTSLDEVATRKLDALIKSTLLGNTENNNGPGLTEVQSVLNGENDQLMELALENAELLKKQQDLKQQQDVANGEQNFLKNMS